MVRTPNPSNRILFALEANLSSRFAGALQINRLVVRVPCVKHALFSNIVISGFALGILGQSAAGDSTAFDLIKEGDKYVGEQARDRVVQIRSEKSVGGLTPTFCTWFIMIRLPRSRPQRSNLAAAE